MKPKETTTFIVRVDNFVHKMSGFTHDCLAAGEAIRLADQGAIPPFNATVHFMDWTAFAPTFAAVRVVEVARLSTGRLALKMNGVPVDDRGAPI